MGESRERMIELSQLGHRTKSSRKDLRARMKAGTVSLEQAMVSEIAHGMEIGRLLLWQPWVGKARMVRLCAAAGVRETRRVGDLTERQRGVLLSLLG